MRNDQGQFLVAKSKFQNACHKVIVGEAIGLLGAMKCMMSMGLTHVIFELDSKVVVDKVIKPAVDVSELGAVIRVSWFLSINENFSVQTNMVAHVLAKASISYAFSNVFENIPLWIASLIFNEMS